MEAMEIIKIVCDYYKADISDVTSNKKDGENIMARQVAMYFCREMTSLSLQQIGGLFEGHNGNKHHATVLHAVKKIKFDYNIYGEFRKDIEIMLGKIIGVDYTPVYYSGDMRIKIADIDKRLSALEDKIPQFTRPPLGESLHEFTGYREHQK